MYTVYNFRIVSSFHIEFGTKLPIENSFGAIKNHNSLYKYLL